MQLIGLYFQSSETFTSIAMRTDCLFQIEVPL